MRYLLSITVLFSVMTGLCPAADVWEKLPSLMVPLGNFAVGMFGDDMVLVGGVTWTNDTKFWLDGIWRYNTTSKTWSETGKKLPHQLGYELYGRVGNEIFLCGGGDGKVPSKKVFLLNSKIELKQIGEIPLPRVCAATAVVGSKLYVVAGGTDTKDLTTLTDSFYSVSMRDGTVETLPNFPGGRFIIPAAAAIDDRIWVFGGAVRGADDAIAINSDDVYVYGTKTRRWEKLKPYPYPVRGAACCVLDDRHILVGGGYKDDFVDDAFIYDTKSDSYSKTHPLPYRAIHCLFRNGETIYCIGGEDRMRYRSDLFYRARPDQFLK